MSKPVNPAPARRSGVKILVVDDEKDFRQTLTEALRDEGYKVTEAESGEEAIKKVEGNGFQIILMDIKLPGINGTQAFQAIKKINPKIVTILMTGYSVENLVKEALANGAQGCLYKPFPLDELLAMIEKALKHQNLNKCNKGKRGKRKNGKIL